MSKLTAGEKFAIKNLRSVIDESAPAGELGDALKLAQDRKDTCHQKCPEKKETNYCEKRCPWFSDYCIAHALLALAAENERLKQGGWTAVADGLPEKKEIYFVFWWDMPIIEYPGMAEYEDGKFWDEKTGDELFPSHYRPIFGLPEPPEPGDERADDGV